MKFPNNSDANIWRIPHAFINKVNTNFFTTRKIVEIYSKLHIKINPALNNIISKVLHESIQFQTPDFILLGHPYLEAAESFSSPSFLLLIV